MAKTSNDSKFLHVATMDYVCKIQQLSFQEKEELKMRIMRSIQHALPNKS